MQNYLSLHRSLFASVIGVRFTSTSLYIYGKSSEKLVWVRKSNPVFLSFSSFNADKYHQNGKKAMKSRYSTVGRCPSFPTVIILHFIHIRALPRGTGMGNTDRACVVLLVTAREKLKLAHQSCRVFCAPI